MTETFSARVAEFANASEARLTQVWHGALRELDAEIARDTPVVTGNLRNSRTVSTTGPITIDFRTKKFRRPDDTIDNAIAGAEIGGTARLGFRAVYALRVEAKRAFMRLAAQRWPAIVAKAVAKARNG